MQLDLLGEKPDTTQQKTKRSSASKNKKKCAEFGTAFLPAYDLLSADNLTNSLPSPIEKSDTAFRTISEVADLFSIPQHVLRFWETRFTQIKPLKMAGNRRYYRPEDLAIINKVHDLLYKQGYTIKGAQKLFLQKDIKEANSEYFAKNEAGKHIKLALSKEQKDYVSGILREFLGLRDMLQPYLKETA